MAKGGKKGAKKGPSSMPKPKSEGAADGPSAGPPPVPHTQAEVVMHSLDIIDSYFRATGKPIFKEPQDIAGAAKALWEADFMLMTHGTEADPIYNYGNAKTLEVFGTDWASFTQTPSRLHCPEETREVRQALLEEASTTPKDLKGLIRVSSSGRKVEFDEGVVWTLVASDGEVFGQAAVIWQWHFPDEEQSKEGAEAEAPGSSGEGAESEAPSASGEGAALTAASEPSNS